MSRMFNSKTTVKRVKRDKEILMHILKEQYDNGDQGDAEYIRLCHEGLELTTSLQFDTFSTPIDYENIEQTIDRCKHMLLSCPIDSDKIDLWLESKNGNFGGTEPLALIRMGRGKKVIQFIEATLKGY